MTLFISMLFALQFFYWMVGKRASRNIADKGDYFLAGKSVKLFPLAMTFLATIVGGGVVLGAADEAYRFGWPVLFYPLGGALGLIVLGFGFGRRLNEFKVSTVAQIFEVVYGSTTLKKIASLLSILSLFMILVGQIIGSQKFLTSMGITSVPLFIAFWAIVILYTAKGGLKAVISTDLVQGCFFSGIFIACLGFLLFTDAPSLPQPKLEDLSPVSLKIWGWVLMPMLFMLIEQDIGQRCFAGATPSIVSKASILSGIGVMIVCIVPVYLGCLAQAMNLEVAKGSSVLMTIIQATTSPWFASLMGCAILAAVISTATAQINAIGSNLAGDFGLSFKKMDPVRFSQVMTGAISILALFSAFFFDNIVDVLIQSYELSVSCLFVPIIIALFKSQGNCLSAYLSILFGALGFILFRIYPIDFPKEILSIVLSLGGFTIGELVTLRRLSYEN